LNPVTSASIVAENASDVLLEHNRFVNDRVGVRFTAPNRDTVVAGNSFMQDKVAGLWAVRGEPVAGAAPSSVRDNHFNGAGSWRRSRQRGDTRRAQ